jgi:hypothetical protein
MDRKTSLRCSRKADFTSEEVSESIKERIKKI